MLARGATASLIASAVLQSPTSPTAPAPTRSPRRDRPEAWASTRANGACTGDPRNPRRTCRTEQSGSVDAAATRAWPRGPPPVGPGSVECAWRAVLSVNGTFLSVRREPSGRHFAVVAVGDDVRRRAPHGRHSPLRARESPNSRRAHPVAGRALRASRFSARPVVSSGQLRTKRQVALQPFPLVPFESPLSQSSNGSLVPSPHVVLKLGTGLKFAVVRPRVLGADSALLG